MATSSIFEKYQAKAAAGSSSGGGSAPKKSYNSMFQKLERQEQAELKAVKELDAVNSDSKKNLSNLLGKKFERTQFKARDYGEDRSELKKVAAIDAVNPESKKNLSNLLGKRHQYAGFKKRDHKEEAKELKDVKAMDSVNAQSQSKLSNLLGNKFKKQQLKAQDYVEDRKELNAVKNMDKVNAQSKSKVSSFLANKLGKGEAAIQAGRLTHADCRAAFDRYKTTPESGPEYLTEPHYKRACRDLMVPIDTYGFARLDKDNSGTIEFGEFLKVLLANNN